MKVKICLVLLGLLAANMLWASKARLDALHQTVVVDDVRDILINPAKLNNTTNILITEWGKASDADDAQAVPHAEGGIFSEIGAFNYGIYLGNESNSQNSLRDNSLLSFDNNIELFLAGDAGVLWGTMLSFANKEDEQSATFKKNQTALGLSIGLLIGQLELATHLRIKDESRGGVTAEDYFESDVGYSLYSKYLMGNYTLFLDVAKNGFVQVVSGVKTNYNSFHSELGMGRVLYSANSAKVFGQLSVDRLIVKGGADKGYMRFPLILGFEYESYTWLTLRGSIQQMVTGYTENGSGQKKSYENSEATSVTAGASLNLGKVKIDGLIGMSDSMGQSVSTSNTNANQSGVLSTDSLLTRVGVTYQF